MLKLMVVDDSNIIRRKIERSCDSNQFEVVGLARNGAVCKPFDEEKLNSALTELVGE